MNPKILTVACIALLTMGTAGAQQQPAVGASGSLRSTPDSSSITSGAANAVTRGPANEAPREEQRADDRSATAGGSDEHGTRAQEPTAGAPGSGTLKDAIELCERLAGVEREICLQQAQENRERAFAPGIGSTPERGGAGRVSGRSGQPHVR